MKHLEGGKYSRLYSEASPSDNFDLLRTKNQHQAAIKESKNPSSLDTHYEERGDNTALKSLKTQYDSRHSSFDLNSRLISPKYYPTKELRAEARKAIHDIKQQLLNEDGGNENSQKRIRELYNRLPEQEVEKWQKLLKKVKENRTTVFKDLSSKHLDQLNQGIKDIKRIEDETVKLIGFIRDVSGNTNKFTLAIKGSDIVRRVAGKTTPEGKTIPKNMDYAKAIDKIPEELRGMVFQRLQEYQGQGIWQDMKNKYMKNEGAFDNKPLAELLRKIPDEEMKLLIKVPEHRNIIPLQARTAYANAFQEIMQATGHERILE